MENVLNIRRFEVFALFNWYYGEFSFGPKSIQVHTQSCQWPVRSPKGEEHFQDAYSCYRVSESSYMLTQLLRPASMSAEENLGDEQKEQNRNQL